MKRVALLVQYDGSHYSGWQKQKNATTVQEILERALLKITNHTVKTFAAGRTDAGVHASGQVVHFDVDCVIPGNSYSDILNVFYPQQLGSWNQLRLKIVGMHAIQQCIDIIDMSLIIVNSLTCSSIIGHGIDIKKY